jgi:23S rRNA pseudouridine1911/1915/1917 synthase
MNGKAKMNENNTTHLLQPSIVWEDDDLLLLSKPAGWVVNQAETTTAPTIQAWMAERLSERVAAESTWKPLVPADFADDFGDPESIFRLRQGMVHRLDKDTSGVLIWAKNPGSLVNLLKQFKERLTQKEYQCLVHGRFRVKEDTIELPIGRSAQKRLQFDVTPTGRPASTAYQVLAEYGGLDLAKLREAQIEVKNAAKQLRLYQGFTLLSCQPKTGRTHQIRVHMKAITHPLVGDLLYVGKKRAVLDRLWCPRQFLHAANLTFTHPRTGERMTHSAPLPTDLLDVLKLLTPNM